MRKKEEQPKLVKEKVKLVSKRHERLDRVIRQMKEGKLETLGTILASDDDIFIRIAEGKIIWMPQDFLYKFKQAISFLDFPAGDLIIAHIVDVEAKRTKRDVEEGLREAQEKKKAKIPQKKR